jgi:hypothetical protein
MTNEKCEFCNREFKKAYVEINGTYHDGLTWLSPNEKYICPECLRKRGKFIL